MRAKGSALYNHRQLTGHRVSCQIFFRWVESFEEETLNDVRCCPARVRSD